MSSWQKRARLGVLTFGVAVAAIVYLGYGHRVTPVAPQPVDRDDPAAIVETRAGHIQRVQGAERKFEVRFDRSFTYKDNTLRIANVRIRPEAREGRQFEVTATEGNSGQDQRVLHLAGDVVVTASDGFRMTTEAATFSQDDGVARAPAAVTFGRGRMSGSGREVSYDTNNDVLVISSEPHVVTTADEGGTMLEFTAGQATLDRAQHLLTLDGMVHIVRGTQTFDSDRAVAFLSQDNDVVTRIEMRGNARVSGESASVAAMSARDIDLDYTDDGNTLETAALEGGASLAMTGQQGAAGRQMSGERLELALDPDGFLTRAVGFGGSGRDRVALTLPAADNVPARTIRARHLDATGVPGKGLTAAVFTDEIEFRERAGAGRMDRVVTAQRSLETAMADDRVTNAVFTGGTRFEDRGLAATAPTVIYMPDRSALRLRDADAKGGPRIEDERMVTEAGEIDVTLDPRSVQARRGVRTTLRPPAKDTTAGDDATGTRLPAVFKQDETATVTAQELDYAGDPGRMVYIGGLNNRATLWQGPGPDNQIGADRLELVQETGDLVATGNATTRLALASGESVGRAREIRLDNEQRTISYTSALAAATAPAGPTTRGGRGAAGTSAGATRGGGAAPAAAPAPGGPAAPSRGAATPAPAAAGLKPPAGPALSQLKGGEGDLQGETITVSLAADENRVARVEVLRRVSVVFDAERSATGDHLIYDAASERYVLNGTSTTPVRLVERRPPDCKEGTGRSLTFHRPTNNMVMIGETRASATSKPCSVTTPGR